MFNGLCCRTYEKHKKNRLLHLETWHGKKRKKVTTKMRTDRWNKKKEKKGIQTKN